MSERTRAETSRRARRSRLVPPDWVFLTAWPLLKAGALRADLSAWRLPKHTTPRRALLGLRAIDWTLFALFPRVAPRSGRTSVVVALTAGQALATAEAMRRARDVEPAISRSLAPQLAWLVYASAVPLLMSRGVTRAVSTTGRAPRRR